MKTQHILLLVAGILGVLAFFFPYLRLMEAKIFDIHLLTIKMSGWQYVEALLDHFDIIDSKRGRKLASFIVDMWQNSESFSEVLSFLVVIYVLIGPIIFLMYGLGYVMRGLAGASYKNGIIFLLTYTFIAWLAFHYTGKHYHIRLNFFQKADWGYWLGCISIVLAAISTLFKRFD